MIEDKIREVKALVHEIQRDMLFATMSPSDEQYSKEKAVSYVSVIETKLREILEEKKWSDFDSAPKNGEIFYAWVQNRRGESYRAKDAYWCQYRGEFMYGKDEYGGPFRLFSESNNPTYWMKHPESQCN